MKASLIPVLIASAIAWAFLSSAAIGARHIIHFGGYDYVPDTLTVQVGDTIQWLGNFSKHPLTLLEAPAGAGRFQHIDDGQSYQYVATVAGRYHYQCDKHVDEGMEGWFTAVAGGTKMGRVP